MNVGEIVFTKIKRVVFVGKMGMLVGQISFQGLATSVATKLKPSKLIES